MIYVARVSAVCVVWCHVFHAWQNGCAQEKQIRAKQGMKQLSKRMMEQRIQALERLRRNMMGPNGQPVRILPRDMEQGLKEFASGVEQLVDRLVRRWLA